MHLMQKLFSAAPFPEHPAGSDEAVLTIGDLQALGFELLLALDAFCRRHDLRYCLCGGTLLGAVRHQGFIPWDDDVDVFMARPDYDRLVELMRSESIAPDTKFACLENDGFHRPFARVYDLRTTVQRKQLIPASGDHAWIDILPVDGLPDDRSAIERLYRRRDLLNRWNFSAFWKTGTGSRKKQIIKRWIKRPLVMAVGSRRWAKMLDRLGRSRPYGECRLVGCVTGGRYGPGEAMERSAYERTVTVTFEGREFPTMSCWKEYLTGIYGDYMQLPPPEQRRPHLDYVTMPKAALEAARAGFALKR